MSHNKIVYMANQIATFFLSKPHDEALEGFAEHINKFWDPRMRRQLLAIIAEGGEGLKPIVLEAAPTIRHPPPVDPCDRPDAPLERDRIRRNRIGIPFRREQ